MLASSFRVCACAVTVAENGEMGRIDGKIGIGAAFAGFVPWVQVALLFANGRALMVAFGSGAMVIWAGPLVACTGEGLGDATCVFVVWVGTAGPFSLPTKDFRNHDGFDDNRGLSVESFRHFESIFECFLESNRDDLGRKGSAASVKYS